MWWNDGEVKFVLLPWLPPDFRAASSLRLWDSSVHPQHSAMKDRFNFMTCLTWISQNPKPETGMEESQSLGQRMMKRDATDVHQNSSSQGWRTSSPGFFYCSFRVTGTRVQCRNIHTREERNHEHRPPTTSAAGSATLCQKRSTEWIFAQSDGRDGNYMNNVRPDDLPFEKYARRIPDLLRLNAGLTDMIGERSAGVSAAIS